MTWLALVLLVLAVLRATRLVTTDSLTLNLRRALTRRFPPTAQPLYVEATAEPANGASVLTPHWLVKFVSCNWCVSFWFSLAGVVGLHFAGYLDRWQLVILAWWGVAGAAGYLMDFVA
jgi:hypothetical protein